MESRIPKSKYGVGDRIRCKRRYRQKGEPVTATILSVTWKIDCRSFEYVVSEISGGRHQGSPYFTMNLIEQQIDGIVPVTEPYDEAIALLSMAIA